jgi:hypothetical protein
MDAISSPPPHSISFGGFRTPAAEQAAPSVKRPASETLLITGHDLSDREVGESEVASAIPAHGGSQTGAEGRLGRI